MKDPEVQAKADKLGLDFEYLSPDGILRLINEALDAPARIQERAVDELKKRPASAALRATFRLASPERSKPLSRRNV